MLLLVCCPFVIRLLQKNKTAPKAGQYQGFRGLFCLLQIKIFQNTFLKVCKSICQRLLFKDILQSECCFFINLILYRPFRIFHKSDSFFAVKRVNRLLRFSFKFSCSSCFKGFFQARLSHSDFQVIISLRMANTARAISLRNCSRF